MQKMTHSRIQNAMGRLARAIEARYTKEGFGQPTLLLGLDKKPGCNHSKYFSYNINLNAIIYELPYSTYDANSIETKHNLQYVMTLGECVHSLHKLETTRDDENNVLTSACKELEPVRFNIWVLDIDEKSHPTIISDFRQLIGKYWHELAEKLGPDYNLKALDAPPVINGIKQYESGLISYRCGAHNSELPRSYYTIKFTMYRNANNEPTLEIVIRWDMDDILKVSPRRFWFPNNGKGGV